MTTTFYELFYDFFTAFFPTTLVNDYDDFFVLLSGLAVFVFIMTIINLIKGIFKVFKK